MSPHAIVLCSIHPLLYLPGNLPHKSEIQTTQQTSTPDRPALSLQSLLGEANAHIHDQVTNTIEQVEYERPGDQELETTLDGEGQGADSSSNARALEVPAQQRGGEVGGGVGVEGAAEDAAGDTGPDGGGEPGLVLGVDGQVGGGRALAALRGQQGLGVGLREVLRGRAAGLDGGQGGGGAGAEEVRGEEGCGRLGGDWW